MTPAMAPRRSRGKAATTTPESGAQTRYVGLDRHGAIQGDRLHDRYSSREEVLAELSSERMQIK
jgi:type IV secretory pathway VirD2 relaxase